jgi:hypothetical protein
MRPRPLIFPLMLAGLLDACGGGGGSATQSSPPPQSTNPPAQNLESVPAPAEPFNIASQSLAASSGGKSYAGTYSESPNNGTTMFHGQEAHSGTISLTITENGSPLVTEIDTVYYLENPYQPLGLTLSYNGAQYDFLYNSTDPLPATLTVGSSGPLGSGSYYVVNTSDVIGSLTETYAVASSPLGGTTVLLTTYATGTINGRPISETINYVVNGGQAVGVASVQVLVNGTTIDFNSDCAGCWDY